VRTKIGEILLILAAILFVVGAIGLVVGFLQQSAISAMGALALIFVAAGLGMKRQPQK